MSLTTPEKVRTRQRKLYRGASATAGNWVADATPSSGDRRAANRLVGDRSQGVAVGVHAIVEIPLHVDRADQATAVVAALAHVSLALIPLVEKFRLGYTRLHPYMLGATSDAKD